MIFLYIIIILLIHLFIFLCRDCVKVISFDKNTNTLEYVWTYPCCLFYRGVYIAKKLGGGWRENISYRCIKSGELLDCSTMGEALKKWEKADLEEQARQKFLEECEKTD